MEKNKQNNLSNINPIKFQIEENKDQNICLNCKMIDGKLILCSDHNHWNYF